MNPFFARFSAGWLLIALGACASRPAPRASETTTTEAPVDPVERPADVQSSDLPPETFPTGTPSPPEVSPLVAIYIDGVALDSFEALGALQSFEEGGLKPRLIAGSGFGCWIALSWAIGNKGRQAEWQAFKWSSWEALPRQGVIGRIRSLGSRSAFDREVARLLPVSSREKLAIPASCPLVERGAPSRLRPVSEASFSSLLWSQLRVPALGFAAPESDSELFSGVAAGLPLPSELDELTRELLASGEKVTWLVLSTRPSNLHEGSGLWRDVTRSRPDTRLESKGLTPAGHSFRVLELSSGAADAASVLRFESRRARLLAGRAKGARLRDDPDLRMLFGDAAPGPQEPAR